MDDLLLRSELKGISTGSISSLINLETCREKEHNVISEALKLTNELSVDWESKVDWDASYLNCLTPFCGWPQNGA